MKYGFNDKFSRWSAPPSDSEEQKIDRTIRAIKSAISNDTTLKFKDIEVFVQGSYNNNTNVRRESDVDVAVVCHDSLISDYPEGLTRDDVGLIAADYTYVQFKSDIGRALNNHFGFGSVTRGNKAFDIKATMSQVEADVAPFFEHRRYTSRTNYLEGVAMYPDNGMPSRIINWPKQHYENSVVKNTSTGRRYKSVVRAVKQLKNEMQDQKIVEASPITGFLIECLIWNVPNNYFGNANFSDDIKGSLRYLKTNLTSIESCKEWGEVSELKYLFNIHQKWTRQQAHAFATSAWSYVGFE